MPSTRLLLLSAAVLLSASACSTGYYRNAIPGSYGTSYRSGVEAMRAEDYGEAAEDLGFAARSGHPRALISYGDLYVDGRGVERDPVRAAQLFEEAYGKHSEYKGRAAMALGRLLLEGGSGPSGELPADPERARALLAEALIGGETRAAIFLGRIYDQGLGTPPDTDKAIAYYRRAADEDANSARRLAQILAASGAPDERVSAAAGKAIAQLEAQAASGRHNAWLQLADIYSRNTIVAADPMRAIGYLERIVDDGDPAVYTRLADLYGGVGRPALESEMLQKAADTGDARAQTRLAKRFLEAGTANTNGPVGRYYAERAIAQGSEAAMVYLGLALIKGDVVEADPASGETLLRRASDEGYLNGTAALGVSLLNGEIPSRRPDEGQRLLEGAAEDGSVWAMSALGFAYRSGRGLPQDDIASRYWLGRAADAGHAKAKQALARLEGA